MEDTVATVHKEHHGHSPPNVLNLNMKRYFCQGGGLCHCEGSDSDHGNPRFGDKHRDPSTSVGMTQQEPEDDNSRIVWDPRVIRLHQLADGKGYDIFLRRQDSQTQ